MGAANTKEPTLTEANAASLLKEYHKAKGVSAKTETAGWDDNELVFLLTIFSSKCVKLKALEEDETTTKKGKAKLISLSDLVLPRNAAIQNIVVFNQSFVNYPSLSKRFWRLLDEDDDAHCSFQEYTQLMFNICRGSWNQRVRVAFDFFDVHGNKEITLDDVVAAVTETSEFICNVARGVLTMKEFNSLKLAKVKYLFANTGGSLTYEEFLVVAERHQELLGVSEILDMVFGRVIRKMETRLKKNLVFGRLLQETALGNVKDITGEMPFVPEVIATAIHLLRKYEALATPELFRVSVSNVVMKEIKDSLNSGMTLTTLFQRYPAPKEDQFMLLACLIKGYCYDLKEPAFTVATSRKIITIQGSSSSDADKLAKFQKLFKQLPTPNRYFLGSLFSFLKDVHLAQTATGCDKCMASSNLGIVFAPCTMYDPRDPQFGATTSPPAFQTFIDHAHFFLPGPDSLPHPNPNLLHSIGKSTKGAKFSNTPVVRRASLVSHE